MCVHQIQRYMKDKKHLQSKHLQLHRKGKGTVLAKAGTPRGNEQAYCWLCDKQLLEISTQHEISQHI